MKTIFRILLILFVAVIVSGGVYALVENTSFVSSVEAERTAPPQMAGTDTQSIPNRPQGGDDHAVSFSRGISQVFVTLVKLSAITVIILLFQKGVDRLKMMKPKIIER